METFTKKLDEIMNLYLDHKDFKSKVDELTLEVITDQVNGDKVHLLLNILRSNEFPLQISLMMLKRLNGNLDDVFQVKYQDTLESVMTSVESMKRPDLRVY